jgi:hypothetical protein
MIGRVAGPVDKRTCSGSAAHCCGSGRQMLESLLHQGLRPGYDYLLERSY